MPAVLTPDLYTGLLFLCLVPSTVQSSIAFTSIARGHVSAAIVSASLSNILGVVLTPLLVVALMPISGAPHVDGSADPRHRAAAAAAVRRRTATAALAGAVGGPARGTDQVVDRGSILLIVYAAFSVGMAEHIWSSVQPWRVVAVAAVSAVLLAVVLGITALTGRLAAPGPRGRDRAAVLRLEEEPGLRAADGAGAVPGRPASG